MTLQSSGAISIVDVAAEFEDVAPHSLSEFYGAALGIASSGQLQLSDFYGKSNALEHVFSSNAQNAILSSYLNPALADDFVVTINAGVTISGTNGGNGTNNGTTGSTGTKGATGTSAHPTGYTGGTGGTGATCTSNGAAGEYALDLAGFSGKNVTFIINGTLRGGNGGNGGKGGKGGKGGTGGDGRSWTVNPGGFGCTDSTGGAGGPGGAGGAGGAGASGGAGRAALKNTSGVNITYQTGSATSGSNGSNGATGDVGNVGNTGVAGIKTTCQQSCFVAGQTVHMADGSLKMIEDVKVGEFVLDGYGKPQEVMFYDRPLQGDRVVYAVNDRLFTTQEHPIMRAERNGFYAINKEAWAADCDMIHVVQDAEFRDLIVDVISASGDTPMDELVLGDRIAVAEGGMEVVSIKDSGLKDQQLYNFVIGGSGTYMVNGVVVSGHCNDSRFNYETGELRDDYTTPDYKRLDEE